MQQLWQTSFLANGEDYLEQLYEDYLHDPQSVSESWQRFFQNLGGAPVSHAAVQAYFMHLAHQPPTGNIAVAALQTASDTDLRVYQLIQAYRKWGHFQAQLDPLGLTQHPSVAELTLDYPGFTAQDLAQTVAVQDFADGKPRTLQQLQQQLTATYCATLGVEFLHMDDVAEIHWIQQRLENAAYRPSYTPQVCERLLDCLTAAEGLEKYLGNKYVGQKRFGLEGGESLIPLLDEIVQRGGRQYGVQEIAIGMAHRGRLNVLVNILGKAPQELFDEFEGKKPDNGLSGDVKYHLGFSSNIQTAGGALHIALAFNPSHLEIVDPVVTGFVCARQHRRPAAQHAQVVGIQIHGDAAFTGQGVVMETFSLSQTAGYGTGGSIHIVINNQIGFTTDPVNDRSTYYCTDIAKMVQAPIFHVNGDDPQAVLFAAQLALDYRQQFAKDVVIDLVCYRRHGHNEADEPAATQPVMYRKIRQSKTTRELYAEKLIAEQILSAAVVEQKVRDYRDALDARHNPLPVVVSGSYPYAANWQKHVGQAVDDTFATGVPAEQLQTLAQKILTLPADFQLQPQVGKVLDEQRKMAANEIPLNWGLAETLAYASLLQQGLRVRLSGQDSGRGTFAHRHAVLHDYQTGAVYIPLQHIAEAEAFAVIDSILSESAVLAFEYGYATAAPETLVIWEAQYGDFANGAQVVIDQFISSGEQKWGRLAGLTLLLPHGYEGSGPEHSSARLERYLQLCAQDNMQVCVPTTPAQIFHLLRRQLLQAARKPLIVMSPKSLLRHKLAVSPLSDLATGAFQTVLPESDTLPGKTVPRVIFCAGKVYYDLLERRRALQLAIPIIRVEQLYPFPQAAIQAQLKQYAKCTDIVWCQEEPHNQGAWQTVQPRLSACLQKGQQLTYVGRPAAAAPAAGSGKRHAKEQQLLVDTALLQGNQP